MSRKNWHKLSVEQLLEALAGRLSARKLRLFACAAVRRLPAANKGSGGQAVTLAERFADGKATAHELASARFGGRFLPGHPAWAVCWAPGEDARAMTERALAWVVGQVSGGAGWPGAREEEEAQADLLRELVSPQMRRVEIDPLVRAWNDGTVVRLARSIYEERAFEQMPILGDALEEAGCTDGELLDHCRQSGRHVPGCWAVDSILGAR
jgi:hypothetical protein